MVTRRLTGHTLELGYTCPARSRNCGVSFDLTVPVTSARSWIWRWGRSG